MKRVIVILLAIVLTCGFSIGCGDIGGGGGNVKIDKTKTQLYVSNFDGGIGTQWLHKAKERFESTYKDKAFEPNTDKVGVQIVINPNRDSGKTLTSTLAGSSFEVFFAEDIPYYDWVSKNMIADISDVVNSKPESDATTILSKMNDLQSEMLKVNEKFYAIPHYEGFRGFTYDVSVFESKLLYFSANKNNGNNGFIASIAEKRSLGPDLIDGTTDDGLPSTYDEFFILCNYMVQRNVVPMVWTGMYPEYSTYMLNAVFDAYASTEAKYFLDFSTGADTAEIVTGFDSSGNPIIEDKTFTENDGYNILQQAGRYYALDTMKKAVSNSRYYYPLSTNPTFSHLDAQEAFIYSSLENKPIAMLLDGNYWENEAIIAGTFERSVADYGERAENRKFGWFPLPRYANEGQKAKDKKLVLKDSLRSYSFINAKTSESKMDLAKLFLKFCYTDESLKEFNIITGITKAMKYDLTETEVNNLRYYSKDFWNYKKSAEIIYNVSSNKIFVNNETTFTTDIWNGVVNESPYLYPYTAFRASSSLTAKDYFMGMWVSKDKWETKYRQYFSTAGD